MKLPLFMGKISYIIGYPGIRVWLWRSHRVYIVLQVNNTILVTKNWLGLHKKWRLPGGGMHDSEDEITALLREVNEELGIQLHPEQLRALTQAPIKTKRGYHFSLYHLVLAQKPALHTNTAEIVATDWLPLDEIIHLSVNTEIRHAAWLLARHKTML